MSPDGSRPALEPVAGSLLALVRDLTGRELPVAVTAWDGSRAGPDDAEVTIEVRSPAALGQLVWSPGEVGLARAHVLGQLDVRGDVFGLLGLRDLLGRAGEDVSLRFGPRAWLRLARLAHRHGVLLARPAIPAEEARLRGRIRSLGRADEAISHHYDVGNDFYRLMLGPSLTYSCAYWTGPRSDLDEAQQAKLELVCRKLGLQPGQRLLDVGCGWGSLVLHAARHHGVEALGITLSEEQAALARRRVVEAGLGGQVEIRVQNFRTLDEQPFDAVASVGMFEHVSPDLVDTYLRDLRSLLRPGGRLLNHAISRPDPRARPQVAPRSFMGRYVFPDTALHEVGTVVSAMAAQGLEVRDVHSLREHYGRTLRAWLANLDADPARVEALVGPSRARVWRLYLAGAALGFEQHRISVHQVLCVLPHADGRSDMAPTRAGLDVTQDDVIDLRDRPPAPSTDSHGRSDAPAGHRVGPAGSR